MENKLVDRIIFPISSGAAINSAEEMYNSIDLASFKLFTGGFINFEYWKNIDISKEITLEQRLESEKNLYCVLLDSLKINNSDNVLEVGCGQGSGTIFALENYNPKRIVGLDFSSFQINKAQENKKLKMVFNVFDKLEFINESAENMSFENSSFDKIFSLQTAHYFNSFFKFSNQAFRVLKRGGKVAIATVFTKHEKSIDTLRSMIQTVEAGVEKLITIDHAKSCLEKSGFSNIEVRKIGRDVFEGFDKWASQLSDFKNSWGRNWYTAYLLDLVDYYLISAEKL